MSLSFAPLADGTAPLARRNPVAKTGAALLFTLPLISTVDPFTPAAALLIELLVLPFFGVRPGVLLRRAAPLLFTAAGILVTMILFAAERTGTLLLAIGPIDVTTGVLSTASALILRIFAIALPGIVVFATTDPTDLADALVQNAKAPARFAIGALAAFRLVPLLGQEWRALTLARRARGVEAGHNPIAKLKLFVSTAFALLVGALRRGVRLSVAMDARGFDSGLPRTYARRQHFTTPDTVLLVAAFLAAAAIIAASVVLGFFAPIIG